MTKVMPSRRYVRADRESNDKIRTRRGTRVATTTEIIGEGEGSCTGRSKERDMAERKTSVGETTRRMNNARDSDAIRAYWYGKACEIIKQPKNITRCSVLSDES